MSKRGAPGTRLDATSARRRRRVRAARALAHRRLTRRRAFASGSRTMLGSSTAAARSTTGSTGSSSSASTSCASTCTGIRSSRRAASTTWEDSDAVLNGLRGRGIPAVVGIVGSPPLGERRQDAELRARRLLVRRLCPRCGHALPLGEAVADVERAEPGALAAPDVAARLRPPDPQPRLRGDPRRDPGREGRRRRHRAARLERRRLARQVDPGDAQRREPASTPTRTIPYPSSSRETPFTRGCSYCETITMGTLEKLIAEVGRAFGPKRIWLTEYGYQTGRLRRHASSARPSCSASRASAPTRRRASTC